MLRPQQVAVDLANNKVYFTEDSRVRVYDLQGNLVDTVTGNYAGFSDGWLSDSLLNNPKGVTVASPNGDIYVADW